MEGDMDLINRWGAMYDHGTGPVSSLGPSRELTRYAIRGFEANGAVLRKYLSEEELAHLSRVDTSPLAALNDEVLRFIAAGGSPSSPAALRLLARYGELADQTTGGNADLGRRLGEAMRCEPVLAAGSALCAASRDFLRRGLEAHGLLPPG
jgi:hypothetical protein